LLNSTKFSKPTKSTGFSVANFPCAALGVLIFQHLKDVDLDIYRRGNKISNDRRRLCKLTYTLTGEQKWLFQCFGFFSKASTLLRPIMTR
jgi:hypothetical protein